MQKRKTFVSFTLCFCIFWPSSLRCWCSFTSLLQEIKNEPARGRKWGSFCAVDRGIGYRFAGRHLCSTRPSPPFCICCPGVCHWWICCVEKWWNNIRQTNVERVPCADGEAEPKLCGGFWSQNGSQGVDREGGALTIEEKLDLQTQIRPRRGAIVWRVRSATSSKTPKLKLKARVSSCGWELCGVTWPRLSIPGRDSRDLERDLGPLIVFFFFRFSLLCSSVNTITQISVCKPDQHPESELYWLDRGLKDAGVGEFLFIYLFIWALFLAEQLHFKMLNHVLSEGDAHLAKCCFLLGGGSICE